MVNGNPLRRSPLSKLLCLLAIVWGLTSGLQGLATQQTLEQKIDHLIAVHQAKSHIPGLALAVTHADRILHLKGYGRATSGQSVTPQTQFLVGSLSKSFTAIAVLQLAQTGRLDLDRPVQTYVPDFILADPHHAAQITVRQLLNQVSGLSDLGFPELQLSQAGSIGDRMIELQHAHTVQAPGTEFHYCNLNYDILARLVEVVSQKPFATYLREHIFEPLRMSNTLSVTTSSEALRQAPQLAQGHFMAFGIPVGTDEMPGYLGGSSGTISTAADMARYMLFQQNGGGVNYPALLSQESLTLTHTPPVAIHSPYGMGWFTGHENHQVALEHNGILSTFYSKMILLPNSSYGIVLLYNVSGLPLIALTSPQLESDLMALLAGKMPTLSGVSLNCLWAIALSLGTLTGIGLAIQSLLYLPQWQQRIGRTAPWRLGLATGWTFVPALFFIATPWLLAAVSDRFFGYALLLRAMPELMIWLSVCAGLGILNGTIRLILLTRSGCLSH